MTLQYDIGRLIAWYDKQPTLQVRRFLVQYGSLFASQEYVICKHKSASDDTEWLR